MPVAELKSRFAIDELPDEDRGRYNTVAGLMQSVAGDLLSLSQSVECAGWRFEVLALEGRRIVSRWWHGQRNQKIFRIFPPRKERRVHCATRLAEAVPIIDRIACEEETLMLRWLKRTLFFVLLLVLITALVATWLMRSSGRPQVDGELKLRGLTAPVKLLRDGLGVPYIFAENTPDLLRAQGFVTAQNRLLQMELFRATWRGELAFEGRDSALTVPAGRRVDIWLDANSGTAQRHPHAGDRYRAQR